MSFRLSGLFGLALLLVLAMGTAKTGVTYEYVASEPSFGSASDDSEDSSTSTHTEESDADGSADEGGYCNASARTYAAAWDGDGAIADASAWGSWSQSWEWNGPPGTAPGGTLSWVANGGGSAAVSGDTDPGDDGGALSASSGSGSEGGSGSGGSGGSGWGYVSGYVQDDDWASLSGDVGVSYGNQTYIGGIEDYGHYNAAVLWQCNTGESTSIPSGTSSVDFGGGASCDSYAGAGAGPLGSGATAGADGSAHADISLSASFP